LSVLEGGPSKLPELGKGLGKTMREVQGAAKATSSLLSILSDPAIQEFQAEMKKDLDATNDQEEADGSDEEAVVSSGKNCNIS